MNEVLLYLLDNLSGHSGVFQAEHLSRGQIGVSCGVCVWSSAFKVTEYLLGSEHVSEHRKQTSIADGETPAVLSQNLDSTPLIKDAPLHKNAPRLRDELHSRCVER